MGTSPRWCLPVNSPRYSSHSCLPVSPPLWSSRCCSPVSSSLYSSRHEGRPGASDVSPGLDSQGCHLIPSICLVCSVVKSCLVLLLRSSFSVFGPFSCPLSKTFSEVFILEIVGFLVWPLLFLVFKGICGRPMPNHSAAASEARTLPRSAKR